MVLWCCAVLLLFALYVVSCILDNLIQALDPIMPYYALNEHGAVVFVKMFPLFCFCSFLLSHTETTTNISEYSTVATRMILDTEFDQAKARVAKIMAELGLAGTLERNVPDGSSPRIIVRMIGSQRLVDQFTLKM